jgi:hypothetical protein
MRRGCRQADKKRKQIMDKEEVKARRRGCNQQTRTECRLRIRRKRRQWGGGAGRKECRLRIRGRQGNGEELQASRQEKGGAQTWSSCLLP